MEQGLDLPVTNAVIDRLAARGLASCPWWKDWRDQPCAIIASGSSVRKEDIALVRDRMYVAAIKENYFLCPWADVVYSCEAHWWRHRRGLPDYQGLKLAYDPQASFCGINLIKIPDKTSNDLLFDEPGVLGSGGNSGFQLFNQMAQFGINRILLLGFDMGGEHWYGRNNWDHANNPSRDNFKRWLKAFNGCTGRLNELGIEVVNASPRSAITSFTKMSVQEALEGWEL